MKDYPIIFSAEMIQAILEGKKTQTRRVIKPQPVSYGAVTNSYAPSGETIKRIFSEGLEEIKPKHSIGDRLWVREAWDNSKPSTVYFASKLYWEKGNMPRWAASRIILEVTAVRVERLQSISESDAIAEGVTLNYPVGNVKAAQQSPYIYLSLIHISEPTRPCGTSRMPSSA